MPGQVVGLSRWGVTGALIVAGIGMEAVLLGRMRTALYEPSRRHQRGHRGHRGALVRGRRPSGRQSDGAGMNCEDRLDGCQT